MKTQKAKRSPARPTTKKPARRAAKSGLDKLSLAQLMALQKSVGEAIAARQAEQRDSIRQKMEAMAKSAGFSVTELFAGRPPAKGRGKSSVPVKFRHPKNPALTWTGRGRKPRWIVEAGGNIERFRVA